MANILKKITEIVKASFNCDSQRLIPSTSDVAEITADNPFD